MTTSKFIAITPSRAAKDTAELWRKLRARTGVQRPTPSQPGSVMEGAVSVLSELRDAPPRTLHSAPVVKSSPLSPAVRAMIEAREFGRRFDAISLDVASIREQLPPLDCPDGDVEFLASDRSLEDLGLSVDGLLQHRMQLIERTINRERRRRHVFVLGGGPAGLMAAVQSRLRDHHVVVCEQRESYSRNRYIGVYKEVTHLMAALGMPERMTYDFSQYRGKRGIMLADIQTFLHAIALKLGVIIYTGAVPRRLDLHTLRSGELELQRATQAASHSPTTGGITRWQHDSVSRVSSGIIIRFDTILEATGGRSGLRETLVGKENVVSIFEIGTAAAKQDPTLKSYFDDPEDHTAEYVDSDYGCPAGLRPAFASALLSGEKSQIPDEIPCFVSNVDASVLTTPMQRTDKSLGLASRIADRDLSVPHDWVVLECRLSDQSLSRYHVEGPLPQTFDFGGKIVPTREVLDKLNPVSLLLRILYAMGVPFDAIDRRRLVDFYAAEASRGDASDVVSTWVGRFRGLRLGAGEMPIWRGNIPGSGSMAYGIIGESLQNAWYRFGVGVDDSFKGAEFFAAGFDLSPESCLAEARRLEGVMRSRSVQILYHLYAVARNKDQGVVGSVLTEYHMEEQHAEDLAESRLRDLAREGKEMWVAAKDIRGRGADPLLEAALDYVRESCCRRVINLLGAFPYPPELLARVRQLATVEDPDWRAPAWATLEGHLSEHHRTLLFPLLQGSEATSEAADASHLQERLVELASARYPWVTPWLRACALGALDRSASSTIPLWTAAMSDPDPLVAEVAGALRQSLRSNGESSTEPTLMKFSTIAKVVLLKKVILFEAIPHEVLVGVASLLTERWVIAGERIFEKGELGDSLYIIGVGRVRVHDGDRIFREMIPHEFFGELSLLDSEPRSASVTALERTLLFRLAQDDFYALISEQPAIARAINRALCRIIRSS